MEPDTETLDLCLPLALHVVYGGSEFRPEWRTEAVVGLATGIMEDAAFERMPILADALEEAGCTDVALLSHCRDPFPHDAQCWALGLALNRYVPPEPEPPPEPRPLVEWRRTVDETTSPIPRLTFRQRFRDFLLLWAGFTAVTGVLLILRELLGAPTGPFLWSVPFDAAYLGLVFGLFFDLARWLARN